MLPDSHSHVICSISGNASSFETVIRADILDEKQALSWLSAFQETTKTTFRVERTHPTLNAKVVFRVSKFSFSKLSDFCFYLFLL